MKRLPLDRRAAGLGLTAMCLFVLSLVVPVYGETVTDSQTRLRHDVKYLASDELEGRGVGTEGLDLAADFIRQEFAQAGLDVAHFDGDAFQEFTMVTGSELGAPNTLQWTGPDGESVELEYDTDFRACSFGGSGQFCANVVFAGYGIDDPDQGYNDFNGVDVKGKAVIIMRRVPRQAKPDGPFAGPHGGISRHGDLRTKVSNAFRQGAAAVLFVNDPHTTRNEAEEGQPPNDELMEFGYGGRGQDRDFPVLHITQDVANRLLRPGLGKTLEELEALIDEDLQPQSAVLSGVILHGTTTVKRVRADVKNVIGVLEGEGPLADETIVIGAHYDHIGRGGPGSGSADPESNEIHNGADDNASGTACLIELARRLSSREEKLARRIVFIAFTAEESGLLGSAHYVKEPLFPLEKTVAMFNMDMVGRLRDDKLTVFGTGTSPRWEELVEGLAQRHNFELALRPTGFGPSDHASFYPKQIPVLHFFTGTHSDYHRPSDTWEKINVEGMKRIVTFIEEALVDTAQASERPEYVEVKQPAVARRSGGRPYFGSIPDFGGEEPGYHISGVAPGSPAAEGGLQAGDNIVEFGDQKIGGLDDFDLALRKFKPGDEVAVVVRRNGEKVNLKVTLSKPR